VGSTPRRGTRCAPFSKASVQDSDEPRFRFGPLVADVMAGRVAPYPGVTVQAHPGGAVVAEIACDGATAASGLRNLGRPLRF
jgi:hypothetical protein